MHHLMVDGTQDGITTAPPTTTAAPGLEPTVTGGRPRLQVP